MSATLTMIRQNRASLRKTGFNSAEIQCLEELALTLRNKPARITGAYIAKRLGVTAQWANKIMRRLDAAGVITRYKTMFVVINCEKLRKISVRAINRARRKMPNALKKVLKSACRNPVFHKGKSEREKGKPNPFLAPPQDENQRLLASMSRQEAMRDLKATYIPVHLRKNP